MPGFNIDLFKGNVGQNGFVQSNKYEVTISTPPFALEKTLLSSIKNATFTEIAKDLRYRCTNASLPGVALRTMDVNRYGLGVLEKMPFAGNYTDISLTFVCDRFGLTHNFWYGWLNYIFSVNGKDATNPVMTTDRSIYTTEYKDNYASQIEIVVYDNAGNPSLKYTLHKAFPISINDSSVSWEPNSNLLKLTTTISFREWSFRDVSIK